MATMKLHAFLLVLTMWCVEVARGTGLSPEVEALADEYFNWRVQDMPQFGTFIGIHDYDDLLDDMSLGAYENRYDQSVAFLEVAEALEANLTQHADLVNIRVLKDELTTYIDGYPFQGFLVPVSFSDGPHVDLSLLISWMVYETPEDYEKLLSRYGRLPVQLQQIRELLEEGVAQGHVHHAISMKGVAEALQEFVVTSAEDSPLWSPLTSFPGNFTQEQITDFQTRGADILVNQVSPAFQQLSDYVATSYTTRPDIAVTSLPNGPELYTQLVRYHTSTSMTVPEIHQLGIEEVARIETEMAQIVSELGYNMTVPEFSAMIRNDSQFFYDNPDDLMAGFENLVYDVITPKLPLCFINIPEAELRVVADPSPDGAGAYYLSGAYDGSRPGVFYVNTYNYDAQPKYSMMTLSMHEGNPGHHLQGSHSIESPTMPYFRRVTDDRNYGQAPSIFPLNTAFIEGWGLYAESLGFDMDLYGDPYDRYGHYSEEIFRACRLVVDTGIHALGWTRQEAIDYMFTHTALSLVEVENEIDRYITWPGQALAYKIGDLKFRELKARAAAEMGDAYDIKQYHEVALESVGPLDLLEDEVNDWINSAS